MLTIIARSSFFMSVAMIAGAIGLIFAGAQMTSQAVAINAVSAGDNYFQPQSITVQAGSAVEWKNDGALPHTVTAESGAFDSGMVGKGKTFSQVFETAGTFPYNCAFHPEMVGSVVVQAAAPPTAAPTAPPAAQQAQQPAAPAAAAPAAAAPQQAAAAPGTLPVGGGPPMIDVGMARGAAALTALGILFGLLGGGAMFLGTRRNAPGAW